MYLPAILLESVGIKPGAQRNVRSKFTTLFRCVSAAFVWEKVYQTINTSVIKNVTTVLHTHFHQHVSINNDNWHLYSVTILIIVTAMTKHWNYSLTLQFSVTSHRFFWARRYVV